MAVLHESDHHITMISSFPKKHDSFSVPPNQPEQEPQATAEISSLDTLKGPPTHHVSRNHLSVGELLRDQRERQSMSLEDCYQKLRIRTQFLAALEQENIAALPDNPTAIRAYLRCYAEFLQLDAEELLTQFSFTHLPTTNTPNTNTKRLPNIPGNTILSTVVLILLVVLAISIAHNYLRLPIQQALLNAPDPPTPRGSTIFNTPTDSSSDPTHTIMLQEGISASTENSLEDTAFSTLVEARLVSTQETWVVMRGGSLSQEFQTLQQAGTATAIPVGEGVSIRVSNPAAVKIVFDSVIDTSQTGQEITFNDVLALQNANISVVGQEDTLAEGLQWINIDALWQSLNP